MFTAVASKAWCRVGDFKPQDFANTAWAFVTLGQPEAQLFQALAYDAEIGVGNFQP